MIDKHLRILIVDPLHAHVMQIEKMLNRMGYYCIATASSASEARRLSRAGIKPFDVLLAADHVVRKPGAQGAGFESYGIENAFIYSRPADAQAVHLAHEGERYWRCGLPEYLVLEWFMARSKRSPRMAVDEYRYWQTI
ncbi:hypothetical protein [Pseudomonas graminis]